MITGAIGAGVAVGSAVFGASQSKKAGKKAKKAARQTAELERVELEESLRRLDLTQERQTGAQFAAAGASGLNIKRGSVAKFLQQQREERATQREFTETQGRRNIDLILQGGQSAKALADAQATGQLIGGLGSAATSLSGGFADLQSAREDNPNVKWWQT